MKSLILGVVLALACGGVAHAALSTAPVSTLTETVPYATEDEAARAALQACAAMPYATRFEYGGLVIKTGDGYRYSAPVRGTNNSVVYTVKLAHGEAVAALYHSHTGHQTIDEAFSHRDVLNALALNVPSYIIIPGRSGHVRVFVPTPGADRETGDLVQKL
jgi:proteasome lid subunit RPN8/RPN11